MNFEEILPYLKEGKKAYRKKYFEPPFDFNKHYIYLRSGEVIRNYDDSLLPCMSYFTCEDVKADDWELLEE